MKQVDRELEKVCTSLGAALQAIQVFEQGLVILLSLLSELEADEVDDDYLDRIYSREARKTMGQLLHRLKGKIKFDDKALDTLNEALDARNFLVHRFNEETQGLTNTSSGRKQLYLLAIDKRKLVQKAEAQIYRIVEQLMSLKGIDLEKLKRDADKRLDAS